MRVWVTGFGPFPGAPVNPTERLVEQLSAQAPDRIGTAALVCNVLPTEFDRAQAIVEERHRNLAPDIALHFGLHREAAGFRLERQAANVIGDERADACGVIPQDRQVEANGPPARSGAWPECVRAAVEKAGLAVEHSDDAGSYVCNAVYYRSLACVAARPGAWSGFVHVPHTEHSDENRAAMRHADLLAGAVAILRELIAAKTGNEQR
ncbi:MAG TPA: pyroglutamyl-peptidase I [Afifellaceae bacterium]|nr:pyroglutamyl-peptidase I [Afifellaceae bacterium]